LTFFLFRLDVPAYKSSSLVSPLCGTVKFFLSSSPLPYPAVFFFSEDFPEPRSIPAYQVVFLVRGLLFSGRSLYRKAPPPLLRSLPLSGWPSSLSMLLRLLTSVSGALTLLAGLQFDTPSGIFSVLTTLDGLFRRFPARSPSFFFPLSSQAVLLIASCFPSF